MNIYGGFLVLALAGCSQSTPSATNVGDAKVGRFQFHEPSKDLMAFVLDTTTGCVSHVAESEKPSSDPDWVELHTNFGKWQCPPSTSEKVKQSDPAAKSS